MTKPYAPRGKILPLLAVMKAEPERTFTLPEAGEVMGIHQHKVIAMVTYALRAEIMFRAKNEKGRWVLKGSQFTGLNEPAPAPIQNLGRTLSKHRDNPWRTTEDDIRVPKVVPGWRPPQMVAPRGGA